MPCARHLAKRLFLFRDSERLLVRVSPQVASVGECEGGPALILPLLGAALCNARERSLSGVRVALREGPQPRAHVSGTTRLY